MADKIQIKRSSEEGKKPTPEQLAEGELALNLKDKKIYAKDSDGVVQEFPSVDAVDVGVQKVNELTGEIEIKGSDNISVTKSGQDLTLDVKDTVALKTDLPQELNLTGGDGIKINGSYPDLEVENEVTKIDDLSDVDTTTNLPQGGAVLVFNGTNWVPGEGGGSSDVDELNDLSDVTLDGVATNQIMQYSGGQWRNVDVPGAAGQTTVNGLSGAVFLEGTGSVSISKPDPNDDNKILINGTSGVPEANSDGKTYGRKDSAWVEIETTGGGSETLSGLTDTTIGTREDNQFLRWDGDDSTGTWKNETVTISSAPDDAQKNVKSDWEATTGDAEILNKPTKLSDFQDDLGYTDTDTGIVKLTHGASSVTGGADREVTFKSSDASVQFELNANNEIDFTVPLAGLNIKGVVQYALPQTQADGKITVNGTEYEVLWDPATYLDEAQSGVVGAALGDLWIVQYQGDANDEGTVPDGNGYVYSLDESGNPEWSLVGPIQGPPGETGEGLLPIYDSDEDPKVDGTDYGATVELSAPDDFQFAVSTRDPTNVFDLNFVERMKVLNTGAFFSVNVSTDRVNANEVGAQDTNDLTIDVVQNDSNTKQVLLKSHNGSGTSASYEATDNDSLVPKSYVDNAVSNVNTNLPIGDKDDTVKISSPQNYQIDISTKFKAGSSYRSRISARPDTVYIPNNPSSISAVPSRGDAKYNPPNVDYDPETNLATPLGLKQGDDAFKADMAAATTGVMRFYQDSNVTEPDGGKRDGNYVGVGLTNQTLHIGTNDNVSYLKLRAGSTETASFHSPLTGAGTNTLYANSWDTLSDPEYPHPDRLVVSNMAGSANTDLRSKYGRCTLYSGTVDNEPGLQVWQKSIGVGYAALAHYGILCGTKPYGSQDLHGIMAYNSFGPDQYKDDNDNINNVFMFRSYPRFEPNTKITRLYSYNTYPITPNNQFTYDGDGKPVETEVPEICQQAYGFSVSNNSLGGSVQNYQVYLGNENTTWSVPNKDAEGKFDGTYTTVPRYPYSRFYGIYQGDTRATNYFLGQICSEGLSSYNNNQQTGDFPKYGWHDDPIPAADQIPPAPEGTPDIPANPYSKAGSEIRFQGSSILMQTYGQGVEFYAYGDGYDGGSALGLGPNSVTMMRRNRTHYVEDGVSKFKMEYGGAIGVAGDTVNFGVPASGGIWNWRVNESEHFEARVSSSHIICQIFKGVTEDGTQLSLNSLAELKNKDGSEYVASVDASVMTKKDVTTALSNLAVGGFPVESLPSKNIQITADDNKGIVEYIAKYQTQNNIEDPDSNKTWRDDPVQFFYAGAKEESWKTFGGPALRITLQGVIETGLAYNTNDQGVTGNGMEGIRNCRFYATLQEASSSATGTTYKWDEASYVFMAKENPLDGGGIGVIDDNTSSPDGLGVDQYSLLTIREGSATSASDIHITANSRYTPTYDYDLITKKYLDEFVLPLPDPDSPLPPVGIGAGLAWDELESTPGLYLSGVYGINGIFSVIGYSDLESSRTDNVTTQELACYWSADGRTWQEGFVGGTFTSLQNTPSGTFYWIPTPNNKYGRYCDGAQTIFTGHAFTSTGKHGKASGLMVVLQAPTPLLEKAFPIYWDSGIKTDTATDPNTGTRPFSDWPEGQAWITSRGYAIQDLEDDDSTGVINIQNDAPTTNTDVALTESGLVICPKVFFQVGGNENYYRTNYQIYKPLQSYGVIQQAQPTDSLATYFRPVTIPVYQDACCSPDGKTVLALDSQDNQFYWYQHKRTTLTVPTGLWQIDGLCCSYDKSRGYFVAVTADKVYVYEAPSNSGFSSDVYGGKLIWTYTIPQAAEWTHLSISGGIYLLMSKSGLMARLDINDSENPTNRTFEMIGANSPTVYSANPVLAGTNGRFLVTGGEDIDGFDDFGTGQGTIPIANVPAGPPRDQKYAWSGGVNDPGASTTTDDVELTDPVDTGAGSGGNRSTRKLLTTQKDANEYFAEEIAKRAVVVTLTQAEYDALSPPDENTLYLIT